VSRFPPIGPKPSWEAPRSFSCNSSGYPCSAQSSARAWKTAALRLAAELGIDPALLHRVVVMSAGTLDSLPLNGALVTLLAVCGTTHRESYRGIIMVAIVSALIALAAVIVLGSIFGSF
jgi:H+/gluconate symporter-like permease